MKEDTQRKIGVMQGYLQGAQVQWKHRCDSNWNDIYGSPVWNWDALDYRVKLVKPKPRTWVVEVDRCSGNICHYPGGGANERIKVREVLDEES